MTNHIAFETVSDGDNLSKGYFNGALTAMNSKLTYLGQNLNLNTIASSASETVLSQVTVAANSANSFIIIMAAVETSTNNVVNTGSFKIRVGTAGTTSDAQVGQTVILGGMAVDSSTTPNPKVGGALFAVAIAASNYTASSTNIVTITGTNSTSNGNSVCACSSLVVLGV